MIIDSSDAHRNHVVISTIAFNRRCETIVHNIIGTYLQLKMETAKRFCKRNAHDNSLLLIYRYSAFFR